MSRRKRQYRDISWDATLGKLINRGVPGPTAWRMYVLTESKVLRCPRCNTAASWRLRIVIVLLTSINARKNPVFHPCLILRPLLGAVFLGTVRIVKMLTEGKKRYDEDKVCPRPGIGEVAEHQGN